MKEAFKGFAHKAAEVVAHPAFFAACVLGVLAWLIAGPFVGWSNQLYHLALNSPTTAITFLLVPLLHVTQQVFEKRLIRWQKHQDRCLKAIMDRLGVVEPGEDEDDEDHA